MFVIWFCQIFD